MKYSSMQQVVHDNKVFFHPDTMAFFNSIIETDLINGKYFVTSERMEITSPKRYTIRRVMGYMKIDTIGEMQQYKSLQGARAGITAIIDNEQI